MDETNLTAATLTIVQARAAVTWRLVSMSTFIRAYQHPSEAMRVKARAKIAQAINIAGYDDRGVAFDSSWT